MTSEESQLEIDNFKEQHQESSHENINELPSEITPCVDTLNTVDEDNLNQSQEYSREKLNESQQEEFTLQVNIDTLDTTVKDISELQSQELSHVKFNELPKVIITLSDDSIRTVDENNSKQHQEQSSDGKLNESSGEMTLCDVTLKTKDGDGIPANKYILTKNSEYFETMFNGGFKESDQNLIYIENINNTTLQYLVDYMNTGTLGNMNEENVEEILRAADFFQMINVRSICIDFLTKSIDDESCLVIKKKADLFGIDELSETCFNYALKNFNSVNQHEEYLHLNVTQIVQLIKNNYLSVEKEEDVYEAVIEWVKYDEKDRKQWMSTLMKYVRLKYIPYSYLFQIIELEPLIEENEICKAMVKEAGDQFVPQSGYSYLTSSILRPRISQQKKLYITRVPNLPRIRNVNPYSPCFRERPINLKTTVVGNLAEHLQRIEWSTLMNESNFLMNWDHKWKDVRNRERGSLKNGHYSTIIYR